MIEADTNHQTAGGRAKSIMMNGSPHVLSTLDVIIAQQNKQEYSRRGTAGHHGALGFSHEKFNKKNHH